MTTKAAKRPLRSLSAHEKMEAIRRVHKGESKAAVARDIGVPESTLRGWCKNEDKIQYLSRQSTPETDDSEPREKRHRYDPAPIEPVVVHQPYNLSVRTDDPGSYSPTLSTVDVAPDSTPLSSRVPTLEPGALNLSKQDSPKDNSSSALSEREKNRAELTRLSIELGLNRPEMFLPNANIAANLSDLSASFTANLGLVAQWNNALLQQVGTKKNNSVTPATTGVPQLPATQKTPKVKKEHRQQQQQHQHQQQQLPPADGSVEDSVWYWLKTQQAVLGLVQNSNQNTVDPNSSWFWKWYKQIAYGQQPQQSAEKPILYQQLTKDANAENIKTDEDPQQPKPAKVNNSNTKARAVLDNLLLNNNNNNNEVVSDNVVDGGDDVSASKKDVKDDAPSSPSEALEYGEKFLRWLERCGDPSVTAVQILQFRYLLNNVKSSANRKNGTTEHKTKVRSRK